MNCPNGHKLDQQISLGAVKVGRCSKCLGLWFDQDELKKAEDNQTDYVGWFNDELWDDPNNFKGAKGTRVCPKDSSALYSVRYGDSDIVIDVCQKCHGIWLDKNEFDKIEEWLKGKSSYDLLNNYFKTLVHAGKDIFTGPEDLKSELHNFMIVAKYLQFRLVAGSPGLTNLLINLPLTPEL
ncbi:MAG: zf-TFIIB domain-containing protein [Candidatus Doudnabacteria bacterium]